MVTKKYNKRYLPKVLSAKDRKTQINLLNRSKREYKKGKYFTRKKLISFKSKPSRHIIEAKKMYKIANMSVNDELVKKTGCSKKALNKIINKGAGAYYSSGSRPNQTAQSWGIARLASALTKGKAGAIDYDILINGCKRNSNGYKSAIEARRKYGYGTRRSPKTIA
jgi:hypothetical protein